MTGLPVCRYCPARIRWVLTIGGKRMPLNPDPDPAGTVVLDPDGRARVLTGRELPAQGDAFVAHWTACPGSSEARRPRPPARSRCRACDKPIDAAAGALHPGCEPAPRPEPAAQLEAAPSHEQEELPL